MGGSYEFGIVVVFLEKRLPSDGEKRVFLGEALREITPHLLIGEDRVPGF